MREGIFIILMPFVLALLIGTCVSGCATTAPDAAGTFRSMSEEIRHQRDKAAAAETERDALKAQLAAASARPAPEAAPAPPPPAAMQQGPMIVPAALPYATQGTGYLYTPPAGWGASPLSILVNNDVDRWVGNFSHREHFCWLGMEIDGNPVIFVQPSGVGGASPAIAQTLEGGIVRTVTVIPPGQTAYAMIDSPGRHHVRALCYVGPPRMTMVNDQQVAVLQLYGVWERDILNPSRITLGAGFMKEVNPGGFIR